MLFEGDNTKDDAQTTGAFARVNRERFATFMQYRSRRTENALQKFLESDEMFTTSLLEAYGESWALSFFLSETQTTNYAAFLRKLAERESLKKLSPEQRLTEFTDVFGKDIERLEGRYLRYFDDLAKSPSAGPPQRKPSN